MSEIEEYATANGWEKRGGLLLKEFDGVLFACKPFGIPGNCLFLTGFPDRGEWVEWIDKVKPNPASIDAAYAAEVARRREAERPVLEWRDGFLASVADHPTERATYTIHYGAGDWLAWCCTPGCKTQLFTSEGTPPRMHDEAKALCERHAAKSEPAETPAAVLTWWGNEDVLYAKHPSGEGSYYIRRYASGDAWFATKTDPGGNPAIDSTPAECQAACEADAAAWLQANERGAVR